MRVALISHYWWYDQQLSNYDPGMAGRTRVDSFNRTSVQVCTGTFRAVILELHGPKTFRNFKGNIY